MSKQNKLQKLELTWIGKDDKREPFDMLYSISERMQQPLLNHHHQENSPDASWPLRIWQRRLFVEYH